MTTPRDLRTLLRDMRRDITSLQRASVRRGGRDLATLDLAPLIVNGGPSGTPTAYRGGGWVSFDGGVINTGNAIGYNQATTVLTLPVGWRPSKQVDFPSALFASDQVWDARIRVNTDGAVQVRIQRDHSVANAVSRITFGAVRYRVAS